MAEPSKWRTMRGGRKPPADDMVQVGWARWDGDEFYDFRYVSAEDTKSYVYKSLMRQGFMPIFANQPEGW